MQAQAKEPEVKKYEVSYIKDDKEIIELYSLVLEGAKEWGIDPKLINFDKALMQLYMCKQRGIIISARKDGKLIGALALRPIDSLWSDAAFLSNIFFYLSKEHRNSTVGLQLLRYAKEYGKANNISVNIRLDNREDSDRKEKLLELYGFKKVSMDFEFTVSDRNK